MIEKYTDAERVFYVRVDDTYGIRRIKAEAAWLVDGEMNTPSFYSSVPQSHMSGLTASAYVDRDNQHAWGWDTAFQPFSVDLGRAEAMVRILRKLDRGMVKLRDKFGYPTTFDAYLAHVASVLGMNRYAMAPADSSRFHRNGESFRLGDATQLQYWVSEVEKLYGRRPVGAYADSST